MSLHERWRMIESRIRGLAEAGELHSRWMGLTKNDSHNVGKLLTENATEITADIRTLRKDFDRALPDSVSNAIDTFLASDRAKVASGQGLAGFDSIFGPLVILSAIGAQISFLLADSQQEIRVRSERALEHLQRSIAADKSIKDKWESSWKTGEKACEALGATHLLQHGIYAFKTAGPKAITDLVYGDLIEDIAGVERFATGIVLTEWKKANSSTAEKKFAEAKKQAQDYAGGLLGGLELRSRRYCIVVSMDDVVVPPDEQVDGVTYRYKNIVVNRKSASARARSSPKK